TLSLIDLSGVKNEFSTTCCVIVLAPSDPNPRVKLASIAPPILLRAIPGCLKNLESSVAITASIKTSGRSSYSIFVLRSEEHTSELQSRFDLVCRLLLEKKK